MKFQLRIILIALLVVCVSAKADGITKEQVGITLDSTVVEADCQKFDQWLDDMVMSPQLDYMLLKFRNLTKDGKYLKFKGDIGAYSLEERKLLWTQPFDYRNTVAYCSKQGVLTVKNNNKVTMLNPRTGEVMWQSKFYPAQFDDSTHIVLGYAGRLSGKLSAYDLTSGQQLWTVNIPHVKNWGWNHVIREDSVH
jgi:outer membrane protein assembly factor BamB